MNTRLSGSEIDELAGDWLAREDAGALDDNARAELNAWLAAESRHFGAYLRLRAASSRLDRLAALRSGQSVETAPVQEPAPEAPAAPEASGWMRRRGAIAAGMGALAVFAGGFGLWASVQPRTYHTDVGEMRRVTLQDGSIVALNTDTVLKVDYSPERREIWLRRGEGHFIVAKDRTRPFVVHALGASVTAVGTAFSVRAEARVPIRVTVTEGVVSVKPKGPDRPKLVGAMQELAVRGSQPATQATPITVASVTVAEIDRRLAWTAGRIILEGQTLGEAADEFNRYNERRLVVAPTAARARVGGVFRTSEVETFARTAGPSLGLTVRVDPNGDIVMEGDPSQG